MATLAQLDGRLDVVIGRLAGGLGKIVEDIGREVAVELVPGTPVDTGFARANWRPSLNSPTTQPITFLDPTGAATIEKIANVAKRWRLGDTLFIVNRAPYIGALNAGSSPQAPAGFVQAALEVGVERAMKKARQRGVLRGGGGGS